MLCVWDSPRGLHTASCLLILLKAPQGQHASHFQPSKLATLQLLGFSDLTLGHGALGVNSAIAIALPAGPGAAVFGVFTPP